MTSIHPATFETQSDIIFSTKVLRPFLYNQGRATQALQLGGFQGCFLKPRLPAHAAEDEEHTQPTELSLQPASPYVQPFHALEGENSPRPGRLRRPPNARRTGGLGAPSRSTCLARLESVGITPSLRPVSAPSTEDEQSSCNTAGCDPPSGHVCFERRAASAGSLGIGGTRSSNGSKVKKPKRQLVQQSWPEGDDPQLINFPEEPDDHRVRLPAHRIGDAPPDDLRPTPAELVRLRQQQLKELKTNTFGLGAARRPRTMATRDVRSTPTLRVDATPTSSSIHGDFGLDRSAGNKLGSSGNSTGVGLTVTRSPEEAQRPVQGAVRPGALRVKRAPDRLGGRPDGGRSPTEQAANSEATSRAASSLGTSDFRAQFGNGRNSPPEQAVHSEATSRAASSLGVAEFRNHFGGTLGGVLTPTSVSG